MYFSYSEENFKISNTSLLYVTFALLCIYPRRTTKPFSGQGRFHEIRALRQTFYQKVKKKGPAGKNFEVFSLRYSQNYILNGKFNLRMDTIRAFFSKIRALFIIFKKGQGRPSPLVARLYWKQNSFEKSC